MVVQALAWLQWASACGSPPPRWAPLFQALKLFWAVICWTGWVYLYKVGQLTACLLISFLIFRKSAYFPSVSRSCTAALYCLSCFTEGCFLTWPLTQRLAQSLHFFCGAWRAAGKSEAPTVPGENLAGGEKPNPLYTEVKYLSWSKRTDGIRQKSSGNVVEDWRLENSDTEFSEQ